MSRSDNESPATEARYRREPLIQPGPNGQENLRTRRYPAGSSPQLQDEREIWPQREPVGSFAVASSSSPTSRAFPPNVADSARYVPAPFSTSDMPAEARRQSIMAMDRKRRLTGSTNDVGGGSRRRNVTGIFNERDETPHYRAPSAALFPPNTPPTTYQRHHLNPSASTAEVIDLTSSPSQIPLPPPSLTRRSSGSNSGIYVVPRWQPDSEVSDCPICKRPFTFLFRRHHCRKCGRVVCNDCSPHRITIPRQFIVNPPGVYSQIGGGRDTVDLTGDEEDDTDAEYQAPPNSTRFMQHRHFQNPSIGGGEKVRLCNPCVPDPQPEPQPNYSSSILPSPSILNRRDDLLTLSDALRNSRHEYRGSNPIEPFTGFVPQHAFTHTAHLPRPRPPQMVPHGRGESELDPSQPNTFPYPAYERHRQRGPLSFDGTPNSHHRHHASESSRAPPHSLSRPRVNSLFDESYIPRVLSAHIPPPRPRLNEEDICPVCRRALPPKGPGGDETAREAHIMACISARDPSNQSSSNRRVASVMSPPRGPMHMLPFMATEKDCVGDDGNIPECSICMVEYDVGDELARLECLCKFHRECISAWFTRKQECPVHKIT